MEIVHSTRTGYNDRARNYWMRQKNMYRLADMVMHISGMDQAPPCTHHHAPCTHRAHTVPCTRATHAPFLPPFLHHARTILGGAHGGRGAGGRARDLALPYPSPYPYPYPYP